MSVGVVFSSNKAPSLTMVGREVLNLVRLIFTRIITICLRSAHINSYIIDINYMLYSVRILMFEADIKPIFSSCMMTDVSSEHRLLSGAKGEKRSFKHG